MHTSVQLDAGTLNGSFTIFLFGGDFNKTNPTEWRKSRSLMAFHGFFLSGSLFNWLSTACRCLHSRQVFPARPSRNVSKSPET